VSYTTVYLSRDGKREPFERLSGRWLEGFGFKEVAKFVAVGIEGGLLVLTVYQGAPGASRSRVLAAQDDGLPPRNRA